MVDFGFSASEETADYPRESVTIQQVERNFLSCQSSTSKTCCAFSWFSISHLHYPALFLCWRAARQASPRLGMVTVMNRIDCGGLVGRAASINIAKPLGDFISPTGMMQQCLGALLRSEITQRGRWRQFGVPGTGRSAWAMVVGGLIFSNVLYVASGNVHAGYGEVGGHVN